MRRSIYRHIRDHLNPLGIRWVYVVAFLSFILMEGMQSDFAIDEMWMSLLFLIIILTFLIKNVRDNYVMDKLSALVEDEIQETKGASKSPIKIKLKKRSGKGFFSKSNNSDRYKPYLSEKRVIDSSQHGALDRGEISLNEVRVYFPVLKRNYNYWDLSPSLPDGVEMNWDNFREAGLSDSSDSILTIVSEEYWRPKRPPRNPVFWKFHNFFIGHGLISASPIRRRGHNMPTIYLCSIKRENRKSDKYTLLTTNELCLFELVK